MEDISVVVPVYNVEKYIYRCVDSILAQTYPNFELILVDDGSPDNCGAICDEYARKDSRVHVIHQKNGGLSAARNTGIDWAFENSDSEWITFIDSDDWIHPRMLECLLEGVQEHDVSISVCGYVKTSGEEPEIQEEQFLSQRVDAEEFYIQKHMQAIPAWIKLYRKALFENIRYPEGRLHEDEFVTYKLILECTSIAYIPASMYYYYQNDSGITKSKWKPKRLDALDAYGERLVYCIAHKRQKIWEHTRDVYSWYVGHTKKLIDETATQEEKGVFMAALKKKLFQRLIYHRDFTLRQAPDLYEIVCPGFMRMVYIGLKLRNFVRCFLSGNFREKKYE